MDYEQYCRLKRGNIKAFRELYRLELRRLWFICYCIAEDVSRAAPLLLNSWRAAVERVVTSENVPDESFTVLVSAEIFKMASGELDSDEDYKELPVPALESKYSAFVDAIMRLSYEQRYVYLLTAFGGLDAGTVSRLLGTPFEETKRMIAGLSAKAQGTPEIKSMDMRSAVYLSTQLKSPNGAPFLNINIPQFLIATLEHDYQLLMLRYGKEPAIQNAGGKTKSMKTAANRNQKSTAKRAGFRYIKPIAITAVIVIAVIAAVIILPRVLGTSESTRIITYNVDEITYGSVSTTISGSGTLTPVTSETLTSSYAGEVESVNFTVGDEVAENDVIAVISGNNGNEEIVAPCDGILLELPIGTGDEVAQGSSVAMIMGKDGFTMGIAVDELNISSVALDQEVTFTVDAVSGTYTGQVSAISYNGSASGGATAFQITAFVEYIEGVYPGMSASAQIVIEDSGDGLLVPVDAVGTSGDDSYIYLAPSGAELGTAYDEDEIDIDSLTKVTVETGMSDGSYIAIESDELAEGNLIIVTEITSTLTGSDSETEGGAGGFPGGGMNFGDFEDFDPGQMPQGGGSFDSFGS